LPTPPGPMKMTTNGSADKVSKQFGALLGTQSTNATRLGDRSALHDALGLHFANGRQRTNEVVGPHLGHALFVRRESEELIEGELPRLHQSLYFRATPTIRHRQSRRFHSLLLRQGGWCRCHVGQTTPPRMDRLECRHQIV